MISAQVQINNLVTQIEEDLSQLDESQFEMNNQNVKNIQETVDTHLRKNKILNSKELSRIKDEFLEYGPITELLKSDDITEIIVNGPDNIWYELNGSLLKLEDQFLSSRTFKNFIINLLGDNNVNFDLKNPTACVSWNSFRVHITRPPITKEVSICFRKLKPQLYSLNYLKESDWCTDSQLLALEKIISDRSNILIAGSTGSGKTTLVNAILSSLPANERIVTLEDVSELKLFNTLGTQLYTRVSDHDLKDYSLSSLVKESLRMRPDRIILGEVRGEEAKDLILALATGHSGSIGTIHAESAKQALLRLEMLVQLGAPQWSVDTIRKLIHFSIHHIIVLDSLNKKQRKLEGIYKITSLESCGFLLQKIC